MFNVTLPDGGVRSFSAPVTLHEIARHISPSLAKIVLAGSVDGCLRDLSYLVTTDCAVKLLTAKDDAGLEVIRHSTAHLLAQAVKLLFPDAQVTIGPVIEDGFFYDFAFSRPFTPEDLALIEAKMQALVKADLPVTRREMLRDEAIAYFKGLGEFYKAEIIASIPQDEVLSLYRQGDFEDLCRGPHVPSTGKIKAFQLTKLAGAYWRGDSKNEMLQRIYGTAWADADALAMYLHRIKEAERRDHRKLGKAMGLFHFQDIAPGMVFWHAKGWTVYQLIQEYMRDQLKAYRYEELRTPEIVDRVLWEHSGHWDNFRDNMFLTETESRQYAIKPMNCPCHIQVFNQGLKSYRDLPVRYAEFGNCHRCEPSGALHGLMRVRNFVQDDGHIFCTEGQIQNEVIDFLTLVQSVYTDFGFTDVTYRLALRPMQRVGSDAVWDKAEAALRHAMESCGLQWVDAPGEGAFYGPKIECSLSDCLGRIWQCGTIQIDFSMPGRLDATYVTEDSSKQAPVMIHRAVLGSFERFIGILLEHYAGKLPVWLSPIQAVILPITDKQADYVKKCDDFLQKKGIRSHFDLRNEKIGFKIREHTLQKIPYLLVVGDKEQESNTISVRKQDGTDLGIMSVEQFFDVIHQEVLSKALPQHEASAIG